MSVLVVEGQRPLLAAAMTAAEAGTFADQAGMLAAAREAGGLLLEAACEGAGAAAPAAASRWESR